MPPADVLGRLARVLRDELASNQYGHESPTRCVCDDCVADAVDAILRELGAMTEEAVLEAANEVACELYADLYGSMSGYDVMRRCLRAAAGLLCARERTEIGRLRSVLREIASKKSLCVPSVWQLAEEAIRE